MDAVEHLGYRADVDFLALDAGEVHAVQLGLGGVQKQTLHHARQSGQVSRETFQQVGLVARVGDHAVGGVEGGGTEWQACEVDS